MTDWGGIPRSHEVVACWECLEGEGERSLQILHLDVRESLLVEQDEIASGVVERHRGEAHA